MRIVVKYPDKQFTETSGEKCLDEILRSLKIALINDVAIDDFSIRRNGIGCNEIKWGNALYIIITEE